MLKRILNEWAKQAQLVVEEDDLINYDRNPKSGLDCWVRLDKNLDKSLQYHYKLLQACVQNKELDYPNNLMRLMFRRIIISKDVDKAIKVLQRCNPSRDWNMFEIDSVEINNIKYYLVWDY